MGIRREVSPKNAEADLELCSILLQMLMMFL